MKGGNLRFYALSLLTKVTPHILPFANEIIWENLFTFLIGPLGMLMYKTWLSKYLQLAGGATVNGITCLLVVGPETNYKYIWEMFFQNAMFFFSFVLFSRSYRNRAMEPPTHQYLFIELYKKIIFLRVTTTFAGETALFRNDVSTRFSESSQVCLFQEWKSEIRAGSVIWFDISNPKKPFSIVCTITSHQIFDIIPIWAPKYKFESFKWTKLIMLKTHWTRYRSKCFRGLRFREFN